MLSLNKDTIVALASAEGNGAIAIIRLSGPEAFSTLSNTFIPLKKIIFKDKILLGYIMDQEEKIDQVLVSSFKSPKSYTGDDLIEISCHGSPYIYRRILHIFIKKGIRMAMPGEFTMRAFLNGKMNLSQAEAISDLISSESEIDHKLAIIQYNGEIYKNIRLLRRKFIDFASIIEINIDFSTFSVENPDYSLLSTFLLQTKEHIKHLLKSFHSVNAMKEGIQLTIIGEPNVGKSTLLNTIVRYDRAIVSDIPGTTRDFIEETISYHSMIFKIIDTAGIRPTKDKIESIGIKFTYEKISNAKVILYIFDPLNYNRIKILKEQYNIYKKYTDKIIIIANKYDISFKKLIFRELSVIYYTISAKNKEDIDELKIIIYNILDKNVLQNKTLLNNIRHYEYLQRTLSTIYAVYHSIEQGFTPDIIATDIRKALYYLGKISGEITSFELLGNIFSRFCIGK